MKRFVLFACILLSAMIIYSCSGNAEQQEEAASETSETLQTEGDRNMAWIDTLTPEAVEEIYSSVVLGRAPSFTLYDTDRREFTLADYDGYVLLLSFWAMEDPASIRLFPVLSQVQNQFRNQKFTVLGVCMDQATREKIQEYADFHRLTYPVVYPLNSQIYQNYNIQGAGEAVLIDRRGNVVGHFRRNPGLERIQKVIKLFLPQEKTPAAE